MTAHRGVVIHIAEGTYEGTIAWCLNPGSDVSAHFVVAKSGAVAQLVDTDYQSWCQVAGNPEWLSIENEGRSGESLTSAQLTACARILARAHQVYGVPLQLATSPSGRGLGHHSMGGVAWGNHPNCPGTPIVAQKPQIIALAGGAASGGNMAGETADFAAGNVPLINASGVATGQVCGSHVALGSIWSGVQQLLARPATTAPEITLTPEQLTTLAAAVEAATGERITTLEAKIDRVLEALVAAGTVAGRAA